MADVARLAGVSKQTVSRVLNDHPSVRPETREQVLAAVRQLSYRRDPSARALVTRRSGMLAVLAFDTTLYGPPATLRGMQDAAKANGFFLSIASLSSTSGDPLEQALEYLYDQAVEGVVVVASTRAAATLIERLPDDLPSVTVEGPSSRAGDSVGFDQFAGAEAVTQHLLSLGHKIVHHISGPADRLDAAARVAGWRAALLQAGAEVPDPVEADWTPRSGHAAARLLLTRSEPTAVFAANDHMALGVLKALRDAEIAVPDRLSVVGFDDVPEAAFYAPPLTTVKQDFAAIGRQSIELLIERIAEPDRNERHVLVAPRLLVRRSSAPPPSPVGATAQH